MGQSSLKIADVATGTGIWAVDLASQLPHAYIEGLDINLEETPPQSWLPKNVIFRHWNVLEQVPTDMIERYDIVHLQYAQIFVRDETFPVVLANLVRLLKPGGYLQWNDANNQKYTWCSMESVPASVSTVASGPPPPETAKLIALNRSLLPSPRRTWIGNLGKALHEAGLEDVECWEAEPKVSTLRPATMNWLWALKEGMGLLESRLVGKEKEILEWKKQWEMVLREQAALKVGMNLRMLRCFGRKPR